MAVQKTDNTSLVLSAPEKKEAQKTTKKKVLDEDTYTEHLEKIITRDFYPDLPKLQAQAEYLDALKTNDVVKLRQIQIKYGPKRGSIKSPSIYDTPATFETPDVHSNPSKQTPKPPEKTDTATEQPKTSSEPEGQQGETPSGADTEEVPKKKKTSLTLDRFLAKNTSEDNASFEEIQAEAAAQHQMKHAWLYEQQAEQEEKKAERLALPGIEQQAIDGNTFKVDTWTYTPRNAVMYVPDGVDLSAKEKIQHAANSKEIVHPNTRFQTIPFDPSRNRKQISEAANNQAKTLQGKIGPDGKEILPPVTPKINGYGFMGTPSPAPGVAESPLMTWGEIEGTPFRLDSSDTPLSSSVGHGPTFKIPDVPKRDRIGLELAEKASRSHRLKKADALKRVTANLASSSPKFGAATKSDRLSSLSPAAQRLASAKLGIRTSTDKALRDSYTPSPSHRLSGDKTPLSLTPGSSRRTPGSSRRTPGSSRSSTGSGTPGSTSKRDSAQVASLTDNLLNLPKRTRAEDYF